MGLIKYNVRHDIGDVLEVSILQFKKYSFIQFCVSWEEKPELPYLQITSGYGRLIGVLFSIHRIGFDIELISRNWSFK
jgi:hypothetical protein